MNSAHAEHHPVVTETSDHVSGSSHPNMVTGLFSDRTSAERAYGAITSRGYDKDDVNLVMSDKTRKAHFANSDNVDTELGNKAAEGAGVGGAIGGTLGAIVAAVAAVGTSLAVPGLGLVIAGPIAAALAGAGAGGLTGGLVGWIDRRPGRRLGGLESSRRPGQALPERHRSRWHPDGGEAALGGRRRVL